MTNSVYEAQDEHQKKTPKPINGTKVFMQKLYTNSELYSTESMLMIMFIIIVIIIIIIHLEYGYQL